MYRALRRLFGKPPPPPTAALTADGLLASDLWIDRPDALEQIERLRRREAISSAEAEEIRRFCRDGYLLVDLGLEQGFIDRLLAAVDRAWTEKPPDLAFAYRGPLRRMSDSDAPLHRRASCRISDLHSHSPEALALYLSPTLFRWVELVFGKPPVAIQSLLFERGSEQPLHRDPMHVQTRPPAHLAAAWIALEDIAPGSGPLTYVRGSHRLPYFQFSPGEYLFDHRRHGDAEARAAEEFDLEQCRLAGRTPEPFLPRQGQALLWHHSLLHGGSLATDAALTRKSFVVHYSTAAHYRTTRRRLEERFVRPNGEVVERIRVVESDRLVEHRGCRGFASPLAAGG